MTNALFWIVTQRVFVISYRCFGTIYQSHFRSSRIKRKAGFLGCPETSVRNYHYSLYNNPEERSSHLFRWLYYSYISVFTLLSSVLHCEYVTERYYCWSYEGLLLHLFEEAVLIYTSASILLILNLSLTSIYSRDYDWMEISLYSPYMVWTGTTLQPFILMSILVQTRCDYIRFIIFL
jgi:hypothetical protein